MIWGESLNLLHRRRHFILQDMNHFIIINSQSVNISSLIHKVASCRFSGKVYYMADSAAARCSEFCALIGPSCSLGISRVGPSRESSFFGHIINRGYYTVARRYEFYFRVAKQYFTNERSEWVKYCFCHEKIKFISSSRRAMFFLLYRQKDIDK